jgi:hypothetical protein
VEGRDFGVPKSELWEDWSEERAKSAMLLWIQKMVIGMNLCPFAFDAMAVSSNSKNVARANAYEILHLLRCALHGQVGMTRGFAGRVCVCQFRPQQIVRGHSTTSTVSSNGSLAKTP